MIPNTLKQALAAGVIALSAIILNTACASAQTAFVAKPGQQKMNYDIYAGGVHVVSADLTTDIAAKSRYTLRLGAYTHGLLAKLAPWNGVFETKGWYDSKKSYPQPETHISNTQWRDEKEINEYHYARNGSFKEFLLKNDKVNGIQPIDQTLTHDTTDVLSATLIVMNNIAKTGKCEGDSEIFDGARRYHLIFGHSKPADLKGNALNVYTGPATECTVEVKPDGGKWHAKPRGWMSIQEQGRQQGTMPTLWFAQVTPGEPAIPVKMRIKTEYGTLFMHLTHYKGPGKSLDLPN